MLGILKEKDEIEKMQQEFKLLVNKNSKRNPAKEKTITVPEELILEDCDA